MKGNINNHKDSCVYPGAWDRPDHWNDPNTNPNTGNNDYSGGGGSGGNAGNVDANGFVMARPNIPQMIEPQETNMCVLTVMRLASKVFGKELNEGAFLSKYCELAKIPLNYFDGVKANQLPNLTYHFFDVAQFVTFFIAINNGYVVLADIPSNSPDTRHSVLVIGYKDDSLIYMDPMTGQQHVNKVTYFNDSYKIVLTNNNVKK